MADAAATTAPEGVASATAHGRDRPTRDTEIKQERRRRAPGTLDRNAHLKLAIPDEIRSRNEDQQLRWINDTGNRLHYLTTQDDYSKVDGVAPVPVGTSEDGKPIYAHLCKKPMEFWREDQAEKSAATREQEKGLAAAARTSADDNRPDDVSYVPTGNSIRTG